MFVGRLIRNKNGTRERGQAMVEFALVIPIFLLVVFAIVDFGMGFHSWITVTNASREGARVGAVGADAATIEAKVRDAASSLNHDEDLDVVVANAVNQGGDSGDAVTVTVDYDYQLITPLSSIMGIVSGGSIGPTLNFHSEAEMRIE